MRRFSRFHRVLISNGPEFTLKQQYRGALIKVEMPALSPTMNSGTIVSWKKKIGDKITPGDVYCEVQTDKATLDYENAAEDGYLARILRAEGSDTVNVGDTIALLVDDIAELQSEAVTKYLLDIPTQNTGHANPSMTPLPAATETIKNATHTGNVTERVPVSPYAQSVAKSLNVDPRHATPTGGTGLSKRVTADDVRRYAVSLSTTVQTQTPSKATDITATQLTEHTAKFEDIPLTPMRRIIASRLHQSKNVEVPHYYISADISVESAFKVIAHLRQKTQQKISINDYIIRAVAKAAMLVPEARTHFINGSDKIGYQGPDTFLRRYSGVDVSVAVATEGGLLTPIVRDADRKGIAEISSEVKALAIKAREGTLKPEEYQGGTVSVSNLGSMGVHHFTAIINPPQSLILAVGTTRYRPRLTSTAPTDLKSQEPAPLFKPMYVTNEAEPYITCTASFDHRVIDGAVGAKWIQQLTDLIENPLSLLA